MYACVKYKLLCTVWLNITKLFSEDYFRLMSQV